MSETATEQATTDEGAQEAPRGTEPEQFDAERAKEKIQKANSEAANLRKRLKELEPLAAKAQELEDARKTETQKAAERAEAAERRAAESEARLLRLEVAAEKGLTPSQGKRLVGSTREELAADADELLKTFQPAAPSFDGGARTSAPAPADMNRVLRQALGRDQ